MTRNLQISCVPTKITQSSYLDLNYVPIAQLAYYSVCMAWIRQHRRSYPRTMQVWILGPSSFLYRHHSPHVHLWVLEELGHQGEVLAHCQPQVWLGHPSVVSMDGMVLSQLPRDEPVGWWKRCELAIGSWEEGPNSRGQDCKTLTSLLAYTLEAIFVKNSRI